MSGANHYRYRAWDGTQHVEPVAPGRMLDALADALLSGDIDQALDRALHRGIDGVANDETLAGLDALREQLRNERRNLEQPLTKEALPQLAEALRGEGGAGSLDDEMRDLLAALAASPDAAARLLSMTDWETRITIESALSEEQSGHLSSDGANISTGGHSLLHQISSLEEVERLEGQIRKVRQVGDLGSVDPDLVRRLLGDDAADRFDRLAASLREFRESGFIRGRPGHLELSARALQHIGEEQLRATLERISQRQGGDRPLPHRTGAHDLTGATRPWEFGDPLSLDLSRTVLQAVRRNVGTPVKLDSRDFAVFEREESTRAATVLAIDLSRSMGERGYLLAAKKLALALSTLIRQRFPRDLLLLSGFSELARPVTMDELPGLSWDRFGFGTNIQDALRWSRFALAQHRGMQRNVIVLTDGEPTAYRDRDGQVHFHHPPTRDTLAETYAEAERLRRDGIDLTVCVLSHYFEVVRFAEELVRRGAGDLIVTSPDDLGSAVTLQFSSRRH
jgi:uncharacterized protein with von Willebrand factor type A (vWA) domain